MDDLQAFVIKEWHVIAIFLTIVGGIFKSEIAFALEGVALIMEQRPLVGKDVKLLGPDGRWQTAKVMSYQYEIPFFRVGCVTVQHHTDDGFVHEKINFRNWKRIRVRTQIHD